MVFFLWGFLQVFRCIFIKFSSKSANFRLNWLKNRFPPRFLVGRIYSKTVYFHRILLKNSVFSSNLTQKQLFSYGVFLWVLNYHIFTIFCYKMRKLLLYGVFLWVLNYHIFSIFDYKLRKLLLIWGFSMVFKLLYFHYFLL